MIPIQIQINTSKIRVHFLKAFGILKDFTGTFCCVIHTTDIDAFVELNGHLLVMEFKRPTVKDKDIRRQLQLFKVLYDRGKVTVIIVRGERNKPVDIECWYEDSGLFPGPLWRHTNIGVDMKTLKKICKDWNDNVKEDKSKNTLYTAFNIIDIIILRYSRG